jgi:hypothetical protein
MKFNLFAMANLPSSTEFLQFLGMRQGNGHQMFHGHAAQPTTDGCALSKVVREVIRSAGFGRQKNRH